MEGGSMLHEEEESFRISTSQQELLNNVPFVGDTLTSPCNCNNNHHHHHDATAEIIPPASSSNPPIILLSAPDTQHVDNQDVFHTPPEDPPLPSPVIHVSQCEFNQAVIDVDDVSEMFHFPGFEKDSVEKSRFLEEDRLSEFPEIHLDEFSAFDRAISDFDKVPMKKLKLGFDPLNVEQDSDELRIFENEISCFHDEIMKFGFDSLEKNVETQQVVQNDAEDVNMVDVEGNKSSLEEEIMEISRMHKGPVLDLMPDSIRPSFEKATANERGSGEDKEKEKEKEKETLIVFDVLKFLAKTAVKEDDGLTLLETLKRADVKFPRPSWWPDDMKSELFKF